MKTVLQFGLLGLLVVGILSTYQLFKLSRQYQKTIHSSELNAISCETLPQWDERLKADMQATYAAELSAWKNAKPDPKSKRTILPDEVLDLMRKKQQLFLEYADYYARVARCLVEGQSIGFDLGTGKTLPMAQSFADSWHRLAKKWIFQKADFEGGPI